MAQHTLQTSFSNLVKQRQAVNQVTNWKKPSPVAMPTKSTCACEGNCPRCAPVQAKLTISQPNDKYEVEADHAANQIVSMSTPHGPPAAIAQADNLNNEQQEKQEQQLVQRKEGTAGSSSISNNHLMPAMQHGGAPMPSTMRQYYEPRFGQNFSNVRLHHDHHANHSADALAAKAYTTGNHIVFGSGHYAPESSQGQHLMAHELSHVVQQGGGQSSNAAVALSPVSNSCIQRDAAEGLVDLGWMLGGDYAEDFFNNTLTEETRQALLQATGTKNAEELFRTLGKQGLQKVMDERMDEAEQQFLNDLVASIAKSPDFAGEIFVDEIGMAIRENWDQFIAFLLGFAALEFGIFAAGFAPEGISTLIAVILQAVILFFFVYFAGVELSNVLDHGMQWMMLVKEAKGNEEIINEASKAFLRMIRHMILMILMVLGVRVKFGQVMGGVRALEAAGVGQGALAHSMQPALAGAGAGPGAGTAFFKGPLPPGYKPPPIKIPPTRVRPAPVKPSPVKPTPDPVPVRPTPMRPPAPSPAMVGADAFARGGLQGTALGTSYSLEQEEYSYPDYQDYQEPETETDTDDEICECQEKAPDAIPIMWPQPLWTVTPSACNQVTGFCDPGSSDPTFDMPRRQILVKRGSTYYNADRPEIGRYITRISNPPFNITVPFAYPIHHKWPMYLGGPGNAERAEGEYTAEGQTLWPPNLVVMNPTVHSTWHTLLETQPWDPRLGPGPGPHTPDGTKFCIVNYHYF